MESKELKGLLEKDPQSVIIIDVREVNEFSDEPLLVNRPSNYQNIPLGIIHALPKEELLIRLESIALDNGKNLEETTLVVSCRSGGRSSLAQEHLQAHGIEVENLEGGYLGW